MTTHSHWEIAALAKTMAMKVTIELQPEHITKRVKTSIKKQLRAGRISGGYRSSAASIAAQIVKKFELPVARDGWRGVHVAHISMEAKRRLLEFFEADWAASLLEMPHLARNTYYKDRHEEAKRELLSPTSCDFYVSFQSRGFAEQSQNMLAEYITDDDKQRIEAVIKLLDTDQPIHITTIYKE
jgi:uncharacterized Ntn-hydrolase superfamily protein